MPVRDGVYPIRMSSAAVAFPPPTPDSKRAAMKIPANICLGCNFPHILFCMLASSKQMV
jgi:hypothetical protein